MSLFENVIIQARTGDLPGAANALIAISQNTISYQDALKDVKMVQELFKKGKQKKGQSYERKQRSIGM